MEVGMLDEEEYAKALELYQKSIDKVDNPRLDRHKKLLDYYNTLTGENETEPNAIMHHRITYYGPPCEKCGKPYRTPLASSCTSCGNQRFDKSN